MRYYEKEIMTLMRDESNDVKNALAAFSCIDLITSFWHL